MRVVFLGNNWLGWQVLAHLKEQSDDVVGVFVHPPEKQKRGAEILECAGPDSAVFQTAEPFHPDVLGAIRNLNPDIAVSALFGYILPREFLSLFPRGAINIHPGYLPYNRGAHPNVWSIVEGTPAGVTIHSIDEGIDTGGILVQRRVETAQTDTGETLYRRLETAGLDLFKENWPLIRENRLSPVPQPENGGSYHRTSDVRLLDEIDLARSYRAGELIDIIRARTFPPYEGAYFRSGNRKIYLRLSLIAEDDR
jgi:methionyl-tRNA formyltransferase